MIILFSVAYQLKYLFERFDTICLLHCSLVSARNKYGYFIGKSKSFVRWNRNNGENTNKIQNMKRMLICNNELVSYLPVH